MDKRGGEWEDWGGQCPVGRKDGREIVDIFIPEGCMPHYRMIREYDKRSDYSSYYWTESKRNQRYEGNLGSEEGERKDKLKIHKRAEE